MFTFPAILWKYIEREESLRISLPSEQTVEDHNEDADVCEDLSNGVCASGVVTNPVKSRNKIAAASTSKFR